MRNAGRLKLGYYPLPQSEADRLRAHLVFPGEPCSALDPCVGEGNAFEILTRDTTALRYAIELDSFRAEKASELLAIQVLQGDTLEAQCRVDTLSFLYLNPPYDFEIGKSDNLRMEVVFLRHTGRWLKPGGVLVFVIPQLQLARCARTLAEHFENARVYRLSDPEAVKFNQVAVLAARRPRERRLRDEDLERCTRHLEALSETKELEFLPGEAQVRYPIPLSAPIAIQYRGLPFDEIEDKLLDSAAYRQIRRTLLRQPRSVRGRPLTPLHGGHVGLLCTAGMLNGVFGEGPLRHMANWQSRKYTTTWQEEGEGQTVRHTREYFSHECTLLWENGMTQVLTHDARQQKDPEEDPEFDPPPTSAKQASNGSSKVVVMPARDAASRHKG
jgi:uncharacterized methyltransferase DUF6094